MTIRLKLLKSKKSRKTNNCKFVEVFNMKDDKILKAYLEGKADAIKELLAKADCDNKECMDCPFGKAEGCVLKYNS